MRKQLDRALAALAAAEQPLTDETVHDARKLLKRVRAGLRLLRPRLEPGIYKRENACFRDAAQPLTELRDATMFVDTLDKLTASFAGQVDPEVLSELRQEFADHQDEVRRRVLEGGTLGPARESLKEARERMGRWRVGRRGWSVLGAGLKRVYRSGRDAFVAAQEDASVANLHEWRKQAKYLRHQLEVLQPLRPARIKKLVRQAQTLGDLLGDDHDLAILCARLGEEPGLFVADRPAVNELVTLVGRRRSDLQAQAFAVGRLLYADRPQAFGRYLRRYWHAWRAAAGAKALV
jgi:CHAD domain-containing protein